MSEPGGAITDYGGYYRGVVESTAEVATLSGLRRTVESADRTGATVRVRGNGHSMNGSAVPRPGEILIPTRSWSRYRFDRPGTVTVGAGAAIWDVNRAIEAYGYELLVYNDGGGPAASVGGYLSAGGFGVGSELHGGFWETVEAVTLVSGRGEVVRSVREDDLFPWLFGSMGRLGIFFEVTLRVQPLDDHKSGYPLGASGVVVRHADIDRWPPIVWYTLFAPAAGRDDAIRLLAEIGAAHAGAWVARPPYHYALPFRRFNPPLVHPLQRDLCAVGIWGTPAGASGFDFERLRALDRDLTTAIQGHGDYLRYVQAELLFEDTELEQHLGPVVHARFMEIRRELDPNGTLGGGTIGEGLSIPPTPPPRS